MIKAKFTGPEGQVLKRRLPQHSLSLQSDLRKIGLQVPIRFVKLAEVAGSVQMEFTPKNEVAAHLLQTISRDGSLEDLNDAAQLVQNAHKLVKNQLSKNILRDRYPSVDSLRDGIHQLTYDAGAVSEAFYFPLTGRIWEENSGQDMEVSDDFLLENAEKIQDHFSVYMSGDTENMAAYYNSAGASKLLLADWGFEVLDGTLYGKVDARLTEPMTAEETNALKDWISGQNSDGLGEGYEQHEIRTEDGEFSVSFWNSGGDYFVYNKDEMKEHLGLTQGQQFGGM